MEVGAVGEVLVGIAEGHERGASLVARLPLDVVYRKRTQNARVLLFLGVLAVEQGVTRFGTDNVPQQLRDNPDFFKQ